MKNLEEFLEKVTDVNDEEKEELRKMCILKYN